MKLGWIMTCKQKYWQEICVKNALSSTNRLIVVHADNERNLAENALLVLQSGSKSSDYHVQMNSYYRKLEIFG